MRKFLVLILLLAPGPAFAQSNVGADTNPPVGAVYTWMGPTLGAHFINGPPSGQVVNNLAGPFPSPPPVMWDLVRNTINSFPLLAENLSGNFFGMQASVGAVEIP